MPQPEPPDLEALARIVERLEQLAADRAQLAQVPEELRIRLLKATGLLARPDAHQRSQLKKARRRHDLAERRAADQRLLAQRAIRLERAQLVYPGASTEPEQPGGPRDESGRTGERLQEPRTCYICKRPFDELHFHYDSLCPPCAAFNWERRQATADLRGRVALLTGGRVKIGFHAGLKLLRAGCRLVVTTRFPRDAAQRYARETDFAEWKDRLEVYGLDLRHTPSVEAFARHLDERYERLDFLINNACQTVRRPPGFYAHLLAAEAAPVGDLPDAVRPVLATFDALRRHAAGQRALAQGKESARPVGLALSAALSQLELIDGDLDRGSHIFPEGRLDADLQQVDLRTKNSWRLTLAEVPAVELLEVHLVNAVAPFVLNARLKPLMMRAPDRDKHIVNVSAMEGQFYRAFKTDKHPHTNMAKAALNMLTRTSAADYLKDGIHMNSVDTGWITDEDPVEHQQRKREEHGFHPPLDLIDAAARICDPFVSGLRTGHHVWGQFLKDYQPARW